MEYTVKGIENAKGVSFLRNSSNTRLTLLKKSLKIEILDGGIPVATEFLPLSQIFITDKMHKHEREYGNTITILMPEWIVRKSDMFHDDPCVGQYNQADRLFPNVKIEKGGMDMINEL
jgi:hypothetical protein